MGQHIVGWERSDDRQISFLPPIQQNDEKKLMRVVIAIRLCVQFLRCWWCFHLLHCDRIFLTHSLNSWNRAGSLNSVIFFYIYTKVCFIDYRRVELLLQALEAWLNGFFCRGKCFFLGWQFALTNSK